MFAKMLRVVSWNINGIRSPLQGVVCQEPSNCTSMAMRRILDELDADIVCFQETKVTSEHSRIQNPYHILIFSLTCSLLHLISLSHFPVLRVL